ncbi:MAG: Zn-ribbon domain-containing OB-fold protein [Thermoplasmata archaeon]|nr:MAG: Zn-ribbon domain-containing OB-fold protein [Thermoplasmata archaeon]
MPFHYFGKINFVPYTKVTKFADYLKDGKLMGTRCKKCGEFYFPPRADCIKCFSDEFEWVETTGKGRLHTYTIIYAAPTGFDDIAPYIIGVLDLDDGGRLLGWVDVPEEQIEIEMRLKAVPKIFEEIPDIKLYYSLEKIK